MNKRGKQPMTEKFHLLDRSDEDAVSAITVSINNDNHRDCPDVPQVLDGLKKAGDEYQSGLLLLVFLTTIGLAVIWAPALPHEEDTSTHHSILKILKTFYRIGLIFFYVWISKNKKSLVVKRDTDLSGDAQDATPTKNESNNNGVEAGIASKVAAGSNPGECSLRGALLVLGTGAMIRYVTKVIMDVGCLTQKDQLTASEILDPIEYTVFVLATATELWVLVSYEGCRFKPRRMLNYGFAICIASDLWGWFGVTITPLVSIAEIADDSYLCSKVNATDGVKFGRKVRKFFGPMSLEYCTISIVVLFHFWNTMLNRHVRGADNPCLLGEDTDRSRRRSRDGADDSRADDTRKVNKYRSLCQHILHNQLFVLMGSALMGLIIMAISIALSNDLELEKNRHGRDILKVTAAILTLILLAPMTFLMIWGIRALKRPMPSFYPLGMNDYLLLLASAFNFIYDIFRLIEVSNMLRRDDDPSAIISILLGIMMSLFHILQTTVQTKFLMSALRNRTDTIRNRRLMTSLLLHTCIINTCHWFISSLAREWDAKIFMPVLGDWVESVKYGHNGVAVMLLVVTPILNLYRFHSAVLAYELMKVRES